MRLLILGGTRFMGFALAGLLVDTGHDVTISSHRPENAPKGVHAHGGERGRAIVSLAQERPFDAVVDFTAYDADSAEQAIEAFSGARYFLISSIWVAKLRRGMLADTPLPIGLSHWPSRLLSPTGHRRSRTNLGRRGRELRTIRMERGYGWGHSATHNWRCS